MFEIVLSSELKNRSEPMKFLAKNFTYRIFAVRDVIHLLGALFWSHSTVGFHRF